ncbi:hypothetical protein K438DRAFT_1772668, partial [Mycena galopus ATCC 62051]
FDKDGVAFAKNQHDNLEVRGRINQDQQPIATRKGNFVATSGLSRTVISRSWELPPIFCDWSWELPGIMAGCSQQMFCLALGAPTKRFELRWEFPLIGCGSSQNISGTSQIRLGTLLSDKGGDSAGVWKSTLLLLQQTSEGGAKGCLADPNGAGFKKIVNQLPAGVGAALQTQMWPVSKKSGTNCWQV